MISAVGHEPDVTISDYVADRRASTPSNATEIAVPDQAEERDMLAALGIRSSQATDKRLKHLRTELENYRSRRVLRDAAAPIEDRRLELDHLRDKLAAVMENELAGKRRAQVKLASSLDAMSPLRVLTRGYSLVQNEEGALVSSVKTITCGARLRLRLSDGSAGCIVESIEEDRQ